MPGRLKAWLPLLAVLPAPAIADDDYEGCIAKTAKGYDQCGAEWIAREDARLNQAWKLIYPRLPAASKAALLDEQRAWVAYKDKSCRWIASDDWGVEGRSLYYPPCRARVIGDQAGYLEMMMHEFLKD